MAEAADEASAVLRVVGVGARVDEHEVTFERAVDEDGEFTRCYSYRSS